MTQTVDEGYFIPDHIAREVLNLPLRENDAEAPTIQHYLHVLLSDLWTKGEDFNTKRPFGNSGWRQEVLNALVEGGLMTGDGTREDDYRGMDLIQAAVDYLFEAKRA